MAPKKELPYWNEDLDIEERLDNLVSQMTLEEKFKILAGHRLWKTRKNRRLGIPTFGMSDGPNGVAFHSAYKKNTLFPKTICLASTWNRQLCHAFGDATAKETRASNRHMILAPGINVHRTPLNGRTFEYFSEDPYLIKELTIPMVEGTQKNRIAVCVKHYVANNQETKRMSVSSEVEERALHEIYIRAFKDVVEKSDPWSIMACYNKVNGIHGCAHEELLQNTLFSYGFRGFVVSDWFATKNIDDPESCLNAGLSLEMPKRIVYKPKKLQEAFDSGLFTEEILDERVKRLLRVFFLVGLFDSEENVPKGERNTAAHQKVALDIALDGMVLLKNENSILPLAKEKIKTLCVLGPNRKKRMGKPFYGGSSAVVPPYEITPLKGIEEYCGEDVEITKKPEEADAVILVMGLNHWFGNDSEGKDRTQLPLSKKQVKLIKKTVEKNPKTIVVLINGSPIAMSEWIDDVPAILEGWYPGMEGGRALAKILFGDHNPSGKLPITFPKTLEDSPAHKSKRTFPGDDKVYYEEGIFVGYRHFDQENIDPLFPFGFGLSYTTFETSNVRLVSGQIPSDGMLEIKAEIKNTGEMRGAEVLQAYIQYPDSDVLHPPKELKGFTKVWVDPQETQEATIEIQGKDLAYYNDENHDWEIPKGKYTLLIGTSSRDLPHSLEFNVQ